MLSYTSQKFLCSVTIASGHNYAMQVNIVSTWKKTWIAALVLLDCNAFLCFLSSDSGSKKQKPGRKLQSLIPVPAPHCSEQNRESEMFWASPYLEDFYLIHYFIPLISRTSKTSLMRFYQLKAKSQHILRLLRFQLFISSPELQLSCDQRYCLSMMFFVLNNLLFIYRISYSA